MQVQGRCVGAGHLQRHEPDPSQEGKQCWPGCSEQASAFVTDAIPEGAKMLGTIVGEGRRVKSQARGQQGRCLTGIKLVGRPWGLRIMFQGRQGGVRVW